MVVFFGCHFVFVLSIDSQNTKYHMETNKNFWSEYEAWDSWHNIPSLLYLLKLVMIQNVTKIGKG